MDVKMVDQDGVWVRNPNAFPFVDPETGTRFEPGGAVVCIKAPKGSWIESQILAGTLAMVDNPATVKPPTEEELAAAAKKQAEVEAALRAGGAGNPSGTSGKSATAPPPKG